MVNSKEFISTCPSCKTSGAKRSVLFGFCYIYYSLKHISLLASLTLTVRRNSQKGYWMHLKLFPKTLQMLQKSLFWHNQTSFYKIEHKMKFIQMRSTSVVMEHKYILYHSEPISPMKIYLTSSNLLTLLIICCNLCNFKL